MINDLAGRTEMVLGIPGSADTRMQSSTGNSDPYVCPDCPNYVSAPGRRCYWCANKRVAATREPRGPETKPRAKRWGKE